MSDKARKERMSSHHEAMAEACMNQAQHCQDLADCIDDEKISKCHAAMAETWKAMAAHHNAEAAGVSKSLGDQMLANRGFPDGISSVIPAPQIRAVPRFGQQDISKTELDPQFAEMFKADL